MGVDPSTGSDRDKGLGHLGPGAVAGAQEQHPHPLRSGRERARLGWAEAEPRVQRRAGGGEEVAEAGEVSRVVRVSTVGGAASSGDEPGVAELAQVVGDEVLVLAREVGQLVHGAVAAGEVAQQLPPQPMPRELKELVRRELDRCNSHRLVLHQSGSMHQVKLLDMPDRPCHIAATGSWIVRHTCLTIAHAIVLACASRNP